MSGLGPRVVLPTRGDDARIVRRVTLPPGRTRVIFESDAGLPPVGDPDPRDRRFRIFDLRLTSPVLADAAAAIAPSAPTATPAPAPTEDSG